MAQNHVVVFHRITINSAARAMLFPKINNRAMISLVKLNKCRHLTALDALCTGDYAANSITLDISMALTNVFTGLLRFCLQAMSCVYNLPWSLLASHIL